MTYANSISFIWTFKYEISLGLCTLLVAYITMAIRRSRRNFPPGPKSLPIVGYLPFLTKHKHFDFMELGKKYGDIFSVRLGSQDAVVMHGGDTVLESLNNPAFFGRSPNVQSAKLRPTSIILGSDFNSWQEQRKFVLHYMKDLRLGKTTLEQDIIVEINHFKNFIRGVKAQPIDVKKELFFSITNNIFSLAFGKRFKYDSPEINLIHDKIKETFERLVPIPLEMAFPWVRYIPFSGKFLQNWKMRDLNRACDVFFRKEIANHEATIDSAHVRDFIDRYLIEINTRKEKNQETSFNHDMLSCLVRDLINAGGETVQTSVLWLIYILAAFPEIQRKIQREIRNTIGSEKTPELQDMKNMPYTHAVLLETMRWKTIIPLSVQRYALNDIIMKGYLIPKGTVVFHNLWAVHHDPRYWDEPDEFKPERFLSSDGMSIVRSKYFMPFSRGGRGCPGESMAVLEMFLYCTSILKEFNVAFPDGTKPTFKATCTLSYRPEPYLVRFIPVN